MLDTITGGNNYLFSVWANGFLECRSTESSEREGSETSGKGIKEKVSKRAGVYGHNTLLLRPSLHFTTLHPTTLHFTTLVNTSFPLI